MCGRATLTVNHPQALVDELSASFAPGEAERFSGPRYNIGPMQRAPVVRLVDGGRLIAFARWGVRRVIGKNEDDTLRYSYPFNTVAETAAAKPQWKRALFERRCVVPFTGFYEWTGAKKARTPLHFTRRDGRMLFVAGVYDEPKDEEPLAFSLLTTAANGLLAPIHDRMPVLLEMGDVDAWLFEGGARFLRPAADDLLVAAPANPLVNKVGNEAPDCLVPPRAVATA